MDTYGKKLTLFEKIGLRILVVMMTVVLSTACFTRPAAVSAEERLSEEAMGSSEENAEIAEEIVLAEAIVEVEVIEEAEDLSEEIAAEAAEESEDPEEIAELLLALLKEDLENFDIHNTDPAVVSLAHFFSGYDGQLVFFGNWSNGRSGSFGRLLGLHINDKNLTSVRRLGELLKHEHGHYEQYKQIGFAKFLFAIAIPSLFHDPDDYYSQPWEVTADMLGGVTSHYHAEGSEEAGEAYLEEVKKTDLLTLILNCFR